VITTTMTATSTARVISDSRKLLPYAALVRFWVMASAAALPSTPCPAMAAVRALVAHSNLPHSRRLQLEATPATASRGRICLSPWRVCSVSRLATTNPARTMNSTNTALVVTRLVVHKVRTRSSPVRSGEARTVVPSHPMTDVMLSPTRSAKKSLIALRTWPGMSYQAGSSSEEVSAGGVGWGCGDGSGVGSGVGFGVLGAVGLGVGVGVGFGAVGAGAGVGSAQLAAGAIPALMPVARTRTSVRRPRTRARPRRPVG
jgi:hypothetical protein